MLTLGHSLLKKDINAALLAFGCIMLTFVGIPGEFFAAIIVAYVTFERGYKSGAMVLAFVALPAFAFLMHKEVTPFDFIFLQCVLVWFFSLILKRYRLWSFVFDIMLILSVLALGIFHGVVKDPSMFWVDFMRNQLIRLNMPQLLHEVMPVIPYFSGLLLFSTSAVIFIELLMARFWSYRHLNLNGKLSEEFLAIRAGYISVVILSLVLIGFLFHLPFAKDFLFAAFLPFVVAGLSYLHYLAKRHRPIIFLLGLLYFGLFISMVSIKIIILLAALGYVDSLVNFRKRFI